MPYRCRCRCLVVKDSKAKDKGGWIESKGAVAVKDGGIGGMVGSKEKRIRRRRGEKKDGAVK